MDIGNKYHVEQLKADGKKKRQKAISFTGVLIEEYERFYLFDCGNYRTTLTKAMLWCGDYAVEAVS